MLFLFKNYISQESESLPGTISWVSPENLASSCEVSKEIYPKKQNKTKNLTPNPQPASFLRMVNIMETKIEGFIPRTAAAT